jgi:DNA-binding NarL/FixJ family response regulator
VAKAFHEGMTADPLDLLSARERQVLQLVVEGNSNAEIARSLLLSPKSVETYRSRIKQKLNLRTLPDLVKFAIRHGLTTLD